MKNIKKNKLAIISAMDYETRSLRDLLLKNGWKINPNNHGICLKKNKNQIIFFCTGIGKKNVLKNMKVFSDFYENDFLFDDIIFTGFAGGMSKDLKVGDVFRIKKVFNSTESCLSIKRKISRCGRDDKGDARDDRRTYCHFDRREKSFVNVCDKNILTVDKACSKADKLKLVQIYRDCELIDMESYYVAEKFEILDIDKLQIFKVVSDDLSLDLEFINDFDKNIQKKIFYNIFVKDSFKSVLKLVLFLLKTSFRDIKNIIKLLDMYVNFKRARKCLTCFLYNYIKERIVDV